jgi:S-methylmethionine-dependent homocysteine/selenocysteine methylase
MDELLRHNDVILMEASIAECMRRMEGIVLHPTLVHTPLIYEEPGKRALGELYQAYIDIAFEAGKPLLILTPTWRASYTRVHESGINEKINLDAAQFLRQLRDQQGARKGTIRIGGLIGCKNDCYRPEEGLSVAEAEEFHAWQLAQLKRGGVDFLIAQTLPSVVEAIGIAKAMGRTGLPYIISFVIARDGLVLDGTDLETAIRTIDDASNRRPLGYMVNCAYPTFLHAEEQPPDVFKRLIGYQANASSLDHCDLDGSTRLHQEDTQAWGELMLELNKKYGVKIIGGCCGTGPEHLRYIS